MPHVLSHDGMCLVVTYLETVVGPATEFQYARLLVEWEIFDVNLAGRFVYSGRLPFDQSLVVDGRFCRQRHFEVPIGTEINATTVSLLQHTHLLLPIINHHSSFIIIIDHFDHHLYPYYHHQSFYHGLSFPFALSLPFISRSSSHHGLLLQNHGLTKKFFFRLNERKERVPSKYKKKQFSFNFYIETVIRLKVRFN